MIIFLGLNKTILIPFTRMPRIANIKTNKGVVRTNVIKTKGKRLREALQSKI
jgi:hypothetical protein